MYILFLLVNCIRKTNQNSYVYKEKLSIVSSYADFWYFYGILIYHVIINLHRRAYAHTRIFNWAKNITY